jgi:hypothetical protein
MKIAASYPRIAFSKLERNKRNLALLTCISDKDIVISKSEIEPMPTQT